jgi:hypothetical protein
MASAADIASVKIQLPEEAVTYGVTDEIISTQIDSVGVTKAILFGLRGIAAKVASIEDISESGSSRTVQFHNRLMAMITDWQSRADAEDASAGTLRRQPGASHRAVRV